MSFWNSGIGAVLGGTAGFLIGGPAGAAIGAGLGGAQGLSTDMQNRANAKALKASNQYDYALWNAANAYNSPVEQMQRLAQAGLNPNLVYGSGNVTGNTTGVVHSNGVADRKALQSNEVYQSLLTAKQAEANLRLTDNQNLLTATNQANMQYQNQLAVQKLSQEKLKTMYMQDFYNTNGYLPGSTLVDTGTTIANKFGNWIAN